MRTLRPILICIFCVFFLGVGCRQTSPPTPSAEFARDARLETQIRALLAAEPILQDEPIEVTVDRGVIFLRGKARGQAQKEKATEIAIRAGGDAPIKNEILVEG